MGSEMALGSAPSECQPLGVVGPAEAAGAGSAADKLSIVGLAYCHRRHHTVRIYSSEYFCSRSEIFPACVNRRDRHRVVMCTRSNTQMNTTAILSAWPDDERDRKRAPVRF